MIIAGSFLLIQHQQPGLAGDDLVQLGCDVGAIANSLIFGVARGPGDDAPVPVLVMASGGRRIDVV